MMSGGGSRKFGPCVSVSLYGVRRDAWKMGWIRHPVGKSSWYNVSEILAATLKGPYCLGDSLGVS